MSSSRNGSGGAYVPPHRRKEPPPKVDHHHPATSSSTANNSTGTKENPKNSHNNHPPNRHPGPGRGGGGRGGGGRGRGGKSPSPKRVGRSHSPQHHQHHDHQHQHQHHHHHLTKEQLHHQKEQLHVLTGAINRINCINLERRPDRWESFQLHLHQSLGKKMGHSLSNKIVRFNAVEGVGEYDSELPQLVQQTWDASGNARWDRHITPPMIKEMSPGEVGCALSHILLWKDLVAMILENPPEHEHQQPNMMILEDDALFYSPKLAMNKHQDRELSPPRSKSPGPATPITYNHDFLTAFQLAWTQLPEDWDIWYLGFSDRGDRIPVDDFHLPKPHHHDTKHPSMTVQLFRPTYGFHTHAYVLTASAAQKLLDHLPVTGPLDVWLADNQWFDMRVYCSVVEGEGWHDTGAWLITQNRKKAKTTDIRQSAYRMS